MGISQKRTKTKTRRRTRDIDQVKSDIRSPKHLEQHKATKALEDLPGLGQWYCIECAKWFEGENSLVMHRKGKNHKRRLKDLMDDPYTQKVAEDAVGLRTDNGPRVSRGRNELIEAMSIEMEYVEDINGLATT